MKKYGIIGKPVKHSASPEFFQKKFKDEGLTDCAYESFELDNIEEFPDLMHNTPDLKGLNVTMPYKETILNYLDEIDQTAKFIGAVNTIKISVKDNKKHLTGYNTDAVGFENALKPYLKSIHTMALIIGYGGSAKSVEFVFKKLGINYEIVTRKPIKQHFIVYWAITKQIMEDCLIIVNTTPIGMYPGTDEFPTIPYEYITSKHLMFDLIYNPQKTRFLEFSEKAGATIINGQKMFEIQAEEAWKIWQTPSL